MFCYSWAFCSSHANWRSSAFPRPIETESVSPMKKKTKKTIIVATLDCGFPRLWEVKEKDIVWQLLNKLATLQDLLTVLCKL